MTPSPSPSSPDPAREIADRIAGEMFAVEDSSVLTLASVTVFGGNPKRSSTIASHISYWKADIICDLLRCATASAILRGIEEYRKARGEARQ